MGRVRWGPGPPPVGRVVARRATRAFWAKTG